MNCFICSGEFFESKRSDRGELLAVVCNECGAIYEITNRYEALLNQLRSASCSNQKIKAIKAIRDLTGLGLEMCRELYEAIHTDQ